MTDLNTLLARSSRVALGALLHDLGKFAERAALPDIERSRLDSHITQYCPFRKAGYHSHKHAAWTALMFDEIEAHTPDLVRGDLSPFASRHQGADITDSLVNAAAMHHRPDTFLQWIIATADRVASGFERSSFDRYNQGEDKTDHGRNHYQARLLPLFEQVRLASGTQRPQAYDYCYPLAQLSPQALFPKARARHEPTQDAPAQAEYRQLWNEFLTGLKQIPSAHRQDWPLWLDHFDTAWLSFTQAIPSATAFGIKPDVSLYDHSKAAAALAVALWRWHEDQGQTDAAAARRLGEREDWDTQKLLLIQGDFFGIQDFIFADGAQTNRHAARLLRGRSFQVALFTELAALRVLEACALPSTSQIINAAGKFMILAPNTPQVRDALAQVRQDLDAWFLKHSFGLAGLGLVGRPASCNDFVGQRFKQLVDGLFADLEHAKLQRYQLTGAAPCVLDAHYPHGVCPYNNRLPADEEGSAPLSRDQIELGKHLTRQSRLLVLREGQTTRPIDTRLQVPIFGYYIAFAPEQDVSGHYAPLVRSGHLVRCWDFSLPTQLDAPLWEGYARRYINAYVPFFDATPEDARYTEPPLAESAGKTFNHLACEDRFRQDTSDTWMGQIALMTLKGDVDNLGQIFQRGLAQPTFARMAALSRQINAFFAVWLPAYCATKYPNTYTVFAGGDDFFLIGPWYSTQQLAGAMAEHFKHFVAHNPELHFSAGMVMSKPGIPIPTLAAMAEAALDKAKQGHKNQLSLFNETVCWTEWPALQQAELALMAQGEQHRLSTGYVYGLLDLVNLASSGTIEAGMWRSRFAYRTRRYVVDKLPAAKRLAVQSCLADTLGEKGIGAWGARYRIPLFNYFYRQRTGSQAS
ncbi:MAG: type III-A CRISPR-associated protein Cas10/Csm1 [Rhodocyclales bacterium]|nr:type III-A CRISPR-associated protein Cas10/Csm1 [Rhodocyclales bacterium]